MAARLIINGSRKRSASVPTATPRTLACHPPQRATAGLIDRIPVWSSINSTGVPATPKTSERFRRSQRRHLRPELLEFRRGVFFKGDTPIRGIKTVAHESARSAADPSRKDTTLAPARCQLPRGCGHAEARRANGSRGSSTRPVVIALAVATPSAPQTATSRCHRAAP